MYYIYWIDGWSVEEDGRGEPAGSGIRLGTWPTLKVAVRAFYLLLDSAWYTHGDGLLILNDDRGNTVLGPDILEPATEPLPAA